MLAACGSSASPDAGPALRVGPLTLLYCTSGTPGDPTCPFNHLDLSPASGEVDLVATMMTNTTYASDVAIKAGTGGLYLVNPRFDNCDQAPSNPWPTLDLQAGAIMDYGASVLPLPPLCFDADRYGAYR